MKRWIILSAVIVAASAAVAVVGPYLPVEVEKDQPRFPVDESDNGPKPLVEVEGELTYKFDSKPQHDKFKRDWVIRNKGEGDLKLALNASTCSCTVAEFPDTKSKEMVVKPGGQTTLHLEFETREFEGAYTKGATVGTNDPKHPSLTFAAEGKIYPAVSVMPPNRTVTLSTITNDTEQYGRAAIYSKDRPELTITKIASSKPNLITAEAIPFDESEQKHMGVKAGYRLHIVIKPGLPLGNFREELVVHTDHPKQPEVRLTLTGRVVGPISVIPDYVRLTARSRLGGKESLTLMVRGFRPTKIEVERKPKQLEIEIGPTPDSPKQGKYQMTVTVPPGTPPADLEEDIVLRTDHPQAKTLKIPISVKILGPS